MAGEVTLVDLVKRFGDVRAVDGINLEMPSGEFFSMLGPSGCGKTTTLRMIAGLELPTSGQILLDGGYLALHDAALEGIVLGERLTQQRGEILAGGVEFL